MRPVLAVAALLLACLAPRAEAQAARAPCFDGLAVLPGVGAFPCASVDLVGHLGVGAFATPGSPAAAGNNDLWGWTDPVTGTEYALVGTYNGLGLVDLSDPARPRLVGKLPSGTALAPVWRDVKVYADHAFVVADGAGDHGVQVLDLTRLRGLTGPPVTLTADAVYPGIRSAHNIAINEATGFAYVVGFRYPAGEREALGLPPSCDAPGVHVLDVRAPRAPAFAGCFSDIDREVGPRSPGYTHDVQCVVYAGPDADYAGRELCVAANEDVVTVFDVTDKAAVTIVTQAVYPNASYTHQAWLTEDHRFLLADDELDERNRLVGSQRTMVFDFADLDDPELAFVYDSGLQTIDHNQYVRGRYSYQSNYETGLRILDLAQIADGTLTEAGFFDTFPPSDAVSFDGQWSNYPYFASGLVIANDDTYGLFVLRPTGPLASGEPVPPIETPFELSPPRPNPTPARAYLTLRVETEQTVRAALYDVAGRRVADVFEGTVRPGAGVTLRVDGSDLPSAAYVLRIVGEAFETSRRVTVAR